MALGRHKMTDVVDSMLVLIVWS